MILGALAISGAVATEREHSSIHDSLVREVDRYKLDYDRVLNAYSRGEEDDRDDRRSWWDYLIIAGAAAVFIYLGLLARVPPLTMDLRWVAVLTVVLLASAIGCGWGLWKIARFK